MKRLVSATLALSLLGSTAAVADPYDHGGYGGGYDRRDHSTYYRGHRDNDGAAVVAGVGLLALAAILASQNHRRHYHHGWYRHDGDRYGYDNGYGRGDNGYGRGYGDGRDGDRYNGDGRY